MHQVEPHFGWLKHYENERDPHSPFRDVEHSEFYFDRQVYDYLAHPLWDTIESEGLLVKILYVHYEQGYAILELFGVWNDLLENDYRLFYENCLQYLIEAGVNRFIFIAENILNIYVDQDDYYDAVLDELDGGWICLLRPRPHVLQEIAEYDLDQYFFHSPELDLLPWRTLKPWVVYQSVADRMRLLLP